MAVMMTFALDMHRLTAGGIGTGKEVENRREGKAIKLAINASFFLVEATSSPFFLSLQFYFLKDDLLLLERERERDN